MKKRIIALFAVILICSLCSVTAFAAELKAHLIDEADLFTTAEESELSTSLDEISKKYDLDIVVLTITTLGGKTAMKYADDYYDSNGYGDNGALLLIAVNEGERYVSTCGTCIDKIDISALGDKISSYLDSRNYVSAVNGLIDYVDKAYSFNWLVSLAISLVIGLIASLIITGTMKGKLKSVRMQTEAANYVKAGSMKVTKSRDIFLYRTVSSRKRESSNSNNNTHTSSSGRTHGGGSI